MHRGSRWRSRAPRLGLTILAGLMVLVVMGSFAVAQQALGVTIQQADLEDDGSTEVLVSVQGNPTGDALPASAFSVTEGGQPVDGVEVEPVEGDSEVEARTVMLLLDTSGSTEGAAIAAAREAATEFAATVTDVGVQVGVVTFADTANLVQAPTDDLQAVTSAIDNIEANGETAFHDAVVVGARALQNVDGQRSMVAFTDGGDTVSEASLQGALTAAGTVDAPVSAVALQSGELDPDALRLITNQTGGTLVQAAGAEQLQQAFGEVATTLTDQYLLTYVAQGESGEFDLSVEVAAGGATASDTVTLLSPRTAPTTGQPNVVASQDPGIFANQGVLWAALGALFLALLVVLAFVLVPTGDSRVTRTLERGMSSFRRTDGHSERPDASAISKRAIGLVESVPKPAGYDDKIQLALDRASWPLRASEFTTLRALAVFTAGLVGWGLFGSVVLGLVFAVAAWVGPRLVLEQRVAARKAKFLAQLPDTLQLLAGSLKAGYGILQAIDTVVKETTDPTASEFRQVLTESRLGLPLEDSLDAMADRIDSEDFRWVTVAVNIQRRVGGNLAELLETVADTLREREMVRRTIASLSAEGRLSAVILTALPVVLALYMVVVNPTYIGTLFTETLGQLMMLGAVTLMVLGALWMRRLIDIDV